MESKRYKKFFFSAILLQLAFFLFSPSIIFSEGYKEEKLFSNDFSSSEDLKKKLDIYQTENAALDTQIKDLISERDWLILKINRIQDSGRLASFELKESINLKENKIQALQKNKSRIEYLVKYHSEMLKSTEQNEAVAMSKKISPLMENTIMKTDQEVFNDVSKTKLQAAVEKAGLSDWVELVGTGSCLRLETTLPILFQTGSAKLSGEYKSFFKKLSSFLKPYDVRILVNGYADTVPIKNKRYPSNFELGASRAANIVHQMVGYGLKPSIFRVESTGKYRFAAKGMSNQKSLERRAEVTVIFSG